MNHPSWERALARLGRLSGNALLLTVGQGLPLLAGAIALPFIYRNVGGEEFGLFTIALSLLGMLAFLDLGIGRSAVRFLSRAFAAGDDVLAANVALHSALWIGGFSLAMAALLLPFVGLIADWWPARGSEASGAMLASVLYIVLVPWPFLALAPVLRAVLEARESFRTIAVIQVVMGTLTFLLPLAVSFRSSGIAPLVAAAVASRLLGTAALLHFARQQWSGSFPWGSVRTPAPPEFGSFSRWIIVSNVVGGAVIHYGDRALLLRMFPFASLAFYNVPLEFLGRFQILVNNAVTAAFPAMSRFAGRADYFERAYLLVITAASATIGPLLVGLSLLAPVGLELWLGPEFREHSGPLVRVLLVGLMCWTLNAGALSVLNARGHARSIALMHVLEVPFYFGALFFAGTTWGLIGVATAWSARHVIEYVAFTIFISTVGSGSEAPARAVSAALVTLNILPVASLALTGHATASLATCAVVVAAAAFWIAGELRRGHEAAMRQ